MLGSPNLQFLAPFFEGIAISHILIAFIMIPLLVASIVLLSSLADLVEAYHLSQPAFQHLNRRSIYQGGWALAQAGSGSTCPADVPNACSNSDIVNLACCPSGQTCFTDNAEVQYCCPTSKSLMLTPLCPFKRLTIFQGADCSTAVTNFPVCANSTWTMFEYEYEEYFCCLPGQLATIPLTGYGGICEPENQVVPTSMLATVVCTRVPLT